MVSSAKTQRSKSSSQSRSSGHTFSWTAVSKKGDKKNGLVTARSSTMARADLRSQGYTNINIKKKGKSIFSNDKGRKIKPMDVAIFTRQLATMLKAGVPLMLAFDVVNEGLSNPTMSNLVSEIKKDVESGNSLDFSIRKHPKYFDDLFCSLVGAGEQAGALETMLDRIATYKEKTEALKSKIKKAMKYPIAVVFIALGVTVLLLLKVVPTFQTMFEGSGASLPAFTQMVINLSDWMQAYWLLLIGGIVGFVVFISQTLKRSKKARDQRDRALIKAPIVGDIIFKATVARFARTLSTTFAAGVPLVDALESVAGATGNVVYTKAVLQIKEDVAAGQQLQMAMRNTGLFPSMAVQMVSIGEESGELDGMLDKVANHFETEVDDAVDGLTSLMEPIIMCVLGVLVGGLMVAMYLPIFKMGEAV